MKNRVKIRRYRLGGKGKGIEIRLSKALSEERT